MTKQNDPASDSSDRPALEITPAMIEAGVAELYENFRLGGDSAELVTGIYVAMAMTSPRQPQLERQAT